MNPVENLRREVNFPSGHLSTFFGGDKVPGSPVAWDSLDLPFKMVLERRLLLLFPPPCEKIKVDLFRQMIEVDPPQSLLQ